MSKFNVVTITLCLAVERISYVCARSVISSFYYEYKAGKLFSSSFFFKHVVISMDKDYCIIAYFQFNNRVA